MADRLTQGGHGAPVSLELESLRRLHEALSSGSEPPRLLVVLLGRRAIAAFPGHSSQQLIVTKLVGRMKAADFDFAPDVEIIGDEGPALPALRSILGLLARHAWWFITGWLALWWFIMLLGDYAFASRLAELALTGSVLTFVLFALLGRDGIRSKARDRLVASGAWQALDARERGVAGLLVAAISMSLAAVVFSHSTMMSLQARGYFLPVTSSSLRGLLVAKVTAGAVALLALSLAGIWRLRVARKYLLVEQEAAASIVESRRSPGN